MISRLWKKIGLIILLIACLWNIVFKLVNKISFDDTINDAKQQMQSITKSNK